MRNLRRALAATVLVLATAALGIPAAGAAPAPGPAPVAPGAAATTDHEHAPPGLPPFPADDPFYRPPAGFEHTAPGTVLRKRQVTAKAYVFPVPATAYQLLVRTTDARDKPVAVVSTVFVPLVPPLGGQRRLLSYQIATDSLGSQCNPSYGLRTGLEKDTSGVFLPLASGWASVMTDYEGPDMAWTVGAMAGHATLDGIRAAETLTGSGLDRSTPVGVWGYSGGGQATAWAAQLQPSYAPELNVKGFVAGDFPGDLGKTLAGANRSFAAGLAVAGAAGQLRQYPELNSLLNAAGRQEMQRIGQRCQIELALSNPFRDVNSLTNQNIFSSPAARKVLDASSTGTMKPTAPVLIQQSALDELIRPEYNEGTFHSWCAMGANVEYRLSYVPEHILYDFASIPDMYAWLQQRFAGIPTAGNCSGPA